MQQKPKLNATNVLIAAVMGLAALVVYQSVHQEPVQVQVNLPPLGLYEKASPQNETISNLNTTAPSSTFSSPVGTNTTSPSETSPPTTPTPVTDIQKFKYRIGYDFTVDMKLSQTPIEYIPWSGNGAPFINIYYRNLDGTAFQDTGMMHNGYVVKGYYVGFSLCNNPFIKLWHWMNIPPPGTELTNRSLVYWSNPVPDDWANLFQGGENCYATASAQSQWLVYACMEGDGELTKYWQEEVNGTLVDHWDYMDYCFWFLFDFPPPIPPTRMELASEEMRSLMLQLE